MEQTGFGNAFAGRPQDHPEIKRRVEEMAVLRRNITDEEVEIAIMAYIRAKWHRLQVEGKKEVK